jgi:iron complex outermembrane receptor protein
MRTFQVNTNYAIGDEIDIGEHFTLMLGYIRSQVHTKNYDWYTGNFSGNPGDEYNKGGDSYTISLLYKPKDNLSFYTTFIQAMEAGAYVSQAFGPPYYRNAGSFLPPTISDQFEIGAKYNWDNKLLLTASLFQIDKANFFDIMHDDNTKTRSQDGRQQHRGVEFNAQGRLFDRLNIFGGFTYREAYVKKIEKSNSIQLNRQLGNTPRFLGKMYVEYDVPVIEGLTLVGGLSYTSKQYYSNSSPKDRNFTIPPFTVGDLGARFTTTWYGHETTFRLFVTNVTNERYWRRVSSAELGDPRTYIFSVGTVF